MSADLILLADDIDTLTPNGGAADYEKFFVRTVLVRADGYAPTIYDQDAALSTLRPYVATIQGATILILGVNSRNQLVGIRSVPAGEMTSRGIAQAITETAASLGAVAVILAGVHVRGGTAERAMEGAESCTGVQVLDRVYLGR